MKPVPPHILARGPPDTDWFGGAVDRSTMTLRVMAKVRGESVDRDAVARLLGCESDQQKLRHWSLHAPDSLEADLDSQVAWILSRHRQCGRLEKGRCRVSGRFVLRTLPRTSEPRRESVPKNYG